MAFYCWIRLISDDGGFFWLMNCSDRKAANTKMISKVTIIVFCDFMD